MALLVDPTPTVDQSFSATHDAHATPQELLPTPVLKFSSIF